jgi:hypothetical protein
MGAAPYTTTAQGLTSAPQVTVNRADKADRLPIRHPAVPAVHHRVSRLLDTDFPSNWHWKG